MATTTNYGWTTPDDTALVKDGAAAIRTLGSSVDTTTKALNPSTTLGDIEYRSSTANTNTRLGIGSTGNVLTVAGGVPSWAAPAAGGGMTLISTTSLTGSSVTLSSVPQTYTNLYAVIVGVYGSDFTEILIRCNGDSGSLYTGGFTFGAGQQENVANGTSLAFTAIYNTSSDSYLTAMEVNLPRYTDTSGNQLITFNGIAGIYRTGIAGGGIYRKSAAVTSVTFLPETGTFSAGTIYFYGVK